MPGQRDARRAARAPLLLDAGALALAALVLDYSQYVFGYLAAKKVLDQAEDAADNKAKYDRGARLCQIRLGLFWSKQAAMVVALGVLSVAVLQALL